MRDIVLPEGNEKELAEMALRLGHVGIVFAYPFAKLPTTQAKDVGLPSSIAAICSSQKEVIACRNKGILSMYRTDEKVREAIEGMKPGIIFGIEHSDKKDFIHHRNSGLNHIMAKLAADKGVTVGISFSDILALTPYRQGIVLGRIRQNIKLLKKYAAKTRLFSLAKDRYGMRTEHDLSTFLCDLGMETREARGSLG